MVLSKETSLFQKDSIKEDVDGLRTDVDKSVDASVPVYMRKSAHSAPENPTASTTIGTSPTTDGEWEYVMPYPKKGYYFYTCEQYTQVNGEKRYSDVRELNSESYMSKWVANADSTYIDGGSIYANSITSNQIQANTLTIGDMSSDTQEEILNSKYVTKIDNNGIWVTPPNKKPTNTSTGAGATGTKIDGNGVGIYNAGVNVAQYGSEARIGQASSKHAAVKGGGFYVYSGTESANSIIAQLGYGQGKNSSGQQVDAPYFSLGKRNTTDGIGNYSVIEGDGNTASGYCAHAEGWHTKATATLAHAQNEGTIANMICQTAIGDFNEADTVASASGGYVHRDNVNFGHYAFIVGNGESESARHNAFAVRWDGSVEIDTDVIVNGYTMANFVVEQGTSGIWKYRKWYNRTYDAWYDGTINLGAGTAWCGGYYHLSTSDLTPPSFSASVTSFHGAATGSVLAIYCGASSTYRSYWLNGSSGTLNNVSVHLDMHGTW